MGLTRETNKKDEVKGDMHRLRPNKVTFRCCIEWDAILSVKNHIRRKQIVVSWCFMYKEYEKAGDHPFFWNW